VHVAGRAVVDNCDPSHAPNLCAAVRRSGFLRVRSAPDRFSFLSRLRGAGAEPDSTGVGGGYRRECAALVEACDAVAARERPLPDRERPLSRRDVAVPSR
jgi:hypothetical protein